MGSFKSDLVETERLVKIGSDCIDSLDCPSEPSERTVTGHQHPTTCLKDAVCHGKLISFPHTTYTGVLHPTLSLYWSHEKCIPENFLGLLYILLLIFRIMAN